MRLLSKAQAAKYCRLSKAVFLRICPVRPIDLGSGDPRLLRYDIRDLDAWIDDLKNKIRGGGSADLDPEEYLERLDH